MYQKIVSALAAPWAIHRGTLEAMVEVVDKRLAGERFDPDEVKARIELAPYAGHPEASVPQARGGEGAPAQPGTAIAVIPIVGVLDQRADFFSEISGGASFDQLSADISRAIADPGIGSVVLDIDSPGGSVFGCEELFQTIMGLRGDKPIIAVVNSLCASAAYWVATAADEIVMTPGGQVGSIGVYTVHTDYSEQEEQAGRKHTIISKGEFKVEGNSLEPLSDEAAAALASDIDFYYDNFTRSVAEGRGVDQSAVVGGFGRGRTLPAPAALDAGMIDRIATLREVLDGEIGRLSQAAGDVRRAETFAKIQADQEARKASA